MGTTHLSRLVDDAVAGQDVVVARAGKPVVRPVALTAPAEPRRPGALAGTIRVADDFDDTPGWLIEAFEVGGTESDSRSSALWSARSAGIRQEERGWTLAAEWADRAMMRSCSVTKLGMVAIAACALAVSGCGSGNRESFRTEAAVLDSELVTVKALKIDGVKDSPKVVPATECHSSSGVAFPLSAFLSWRIPHDDLAVAQSSFRSELEGRGYRVVRGFHRQKYGIPRVSGEFERGAGEGRSLRASVLIDLGPVDVMRVWLGVSPSSAC